MAADTTIRVDADTSAAQRSLGQLRQSFDGLRTVVAGVAGALAAREFGQITTSFENLRVSLQILYKDVQTGNIVFEDIKRFAQTSSFSVEDLTATVIKLRSAGLNPTLNQLRFFGEVSAVAADKVGALQAITDLYARTTAGGLGLEDLNRLADRGIPVFTVLKDTLGLNRLEITKVGQSAEGAKLILAALEQGLSKTFGGSSALRANTLGQATSNLRDAFNNLIDSMGQEGGLNASLAKLANALAVVLEKATPLAVVLARGLGAAIEFVANYAKTFTAIMIGLSALIGAALIGKVVALAAAFLKLGQVLMLLTRTPVVALFGVLSAGLGIVLGKALGVRKEMEELEGQMKETGKGLEEGDPVGTTDNLKGKVAGLNQEFKKQSAEIANIVKEFARLNDRQFDTLALETRLVGKSDEEAEKLRALADLSNKYYDTRNQLQERLNRLTDEEKKMGLGGVIKENLRLLDQQYQRDAVGLEGRIDLLQSARTIERDRLATIERITQQIEEQNRAGQAFANSQLKIREQEQTQAFERTQIGQGPLARQISQIRENSRRAALEAGRAFAAAFEDGGDGLTPERAAELQRGLDAIAEAYGRINDQQIENLNRSRDWSTGWEEAFAAYVDNAYNAADQARGYFETFTRGFEDAIVNFVKTGKLSFKDLINSLIAEFARLQAQKLFLNLFGDSKGNGGTLMNLFTWGKSLFGMANGGQVQSGHPYMVGERGPELFVPFNNGRIVANNQLGGQVTQPVIQNVNYTIQAVDASSFRQLVARDPSFIHAVAERGRQSQPTRRMG